LESLRGQRIAISNQGATTPVLLKILLARRRLQLVPEVSSLRYPEILEEYPAALLIGDEALDASQKEGDLFSWDLGEAWSGWTKLPAVFALWVIRRHLVDQRPELLARLTEALHTSTAWGKAHPRELIAAMRKVFPWEANFLRRYLDGISYEFDAKAWRGLRHFARQAEAIRELPKGTLKRLRQSTLIEMASLLRGSHDAGR
jgi:chorismate dehydratase